MNTAILTTLIAVSTSLIVSFLAPVYLKWFEEKRKIRKLLGAFKAEIDTIVELIELRHYVSKIEQVFDLSVKDNTARYFKIPLNTQHYTKTFDTYLADVAMLPDIVNKQIIRFYLILFSLSEDLPVLGGTHGDLCLKDFLDMVHADIQLFRQLLFIGKDISKCINTELLNLKDKAFLKFLNE
jgi:hypothetical protein